MQAIFFRVWEALILLLHYCRASIKDCLLKVIDLEVIQYHHQYSHYCQSQYTFGVATLDDLIIKANDMT